MANYNPTGLLSLLIGDAGPTPADASPTPTKVGANLCSAILELKSTTRGFLPPRMTTAQVNAIQYPVNGMRVFDTNLLADKVYINGTWALQTVPATGFLYATGNLTAANIQGMSANGVQLLGAPGAGNLIVVQRATLNAAYAGALFAAGGEIYLQYGVAGNSTIEATSGINAAFLTATMANKSVNTFGSDDFVLSTALQGINQPISITNAGVPFTGGGTTTVTWHIWYSIISAV